MKIFFHDIAIHFPLKIPGAWVEFRKMNRVSKCDSNFENTSGKRLLFLFLFLEKQKKERKKIWAMQKRRERTCNHKLLDTSAMLRHFGLLSASLRSASGGQSK
jgi:hypothetical protein